MTRTSGTKRKTHGIRAYLLITLTLITTLVGAQEFTPRSPKAPRNHQEQNQVAFQEVEGHISLKEWQMKKQNLHEWLTAERVAGAEDFALSYGPGEEDSYNEKNSDPGKIIRVGAVVETDLAISFEDADLNMKSGVQSIGVMEQLQDGFVWTSIIEAEGASAMRLHFQNFNLPDGVELYLYNEHGQAHGPYFDSGLDRDGEFWSHTLFGERVILQLRAQTGALLEQSSFNIIEMAPMNQRFLMAQRYNHRISNKHCNYNVDCVQNAMCYSGFSTLKKAVAHIQFISGGSSYICSGALLNDSAVGAIPWFATANHCIGGQNVAETVEAFFQYQSNCGSCSDSLSGVPSVVGSDLRAHGATADFSLLELSGFPSGGYGLLGWTTSTINDDDGTEVHILGHPKGAPQAYSLGEVDIDRYSNSEKLYSINLDGVHEGGSSGSPTIISGGKWVGPYVGVTYGGSYDRCDPTTYRARTTAFSAFQESVLPYLRPENDYPMHVEQVEVKVVNTLFYKINVWIKDELNNPIPHATVRVNVGNNTLIGTTGGAGKASFKIFKTQNSLTACVSSLSHPYFSYDEADNIMTCDTY